MLIASVTISPWGLSAIGIFVVFGALSTLVLVLMGFSKLLADVPDPGHGGHASAAAPKPAPKPSAAPAGDDTEALLKVALAAYGLHRSRRITVRSPETTSSWLHSGRASQVQRFPNKR